MTAPPPPPRSTPVVDSAGMFDQKWTNWFNQVSQSQGINSPTAAEQNANVTPTNYAYAPGDVRRYGADPTGASDSTAAFASALLTGHNISGGSENSYLVSAVTAAIAGVLIDLTGNTITSKAGTTTPILTLAAAHIIVRGGTWDGNKANQSGTTPDYGRSCINIGSSAGADYCIVEETQIQNCYGLGISGHLCNYATIRTNRVSGTNNHGIYVESVTQDAVGNVIEGNAVQMAAATAVGIYLIGKADNSFKQRRWRVSGNNCLGASAGTTTADVGITVRGIDGICANNHTLYFDLGISCDVTSRSIISGNRVEGPNGPTGYCLEANASENVLEGNLLKGGKYGLVMSSSVDSLDFNTIVGNVFELQTVYGLYIAPSGGQTANDLLIEGNTFTYAGLGAAVKAINLANSCQYVHVNGNTILGPGSGVANGRAVFMDTAAPGFLTVTNNRIGGWERPVSCFSAGASTYTNICVNGNDFSQDSNSSSLFSVTEGSAVLGAGCTQIGNTDSGGKSPDYPIWTGSAATSLLETYGTGAPAATCANGSKYIQTNAGAASPLWIRANGAWIQVTLP